MTASQVPASAWFTTTFTRRANYVTHAHREVASKAFVLRHEALSRILGLSSNQYSDEKGLVVFNTLAWDRTEVIEVPIEDGMPQLQQYSATKNSGYTLGRLLPLVGVSK
ncbi:hypothetical protein BC936DRAFT_142628 [Jimgerdemannia flammicorona]|uniref:Uncharacterized protein n=1 Tax=Jimgerdemannia flammicorona TaxID=994334 RepID=A0A433DEY4_9FUNG|nr:hypothetical protein BC936DRAFT_142628 [Jimgerdemannia flammicorona]